MRIGLFAFIYTNNKSHNIYFYNFDPMKSNTNHVIIMAGGIGSRFWPMSTPERPKQFIDVLGCGRTLIQLTADRFKGVCPPEHIWVVTSKSFASLVREQLPEIPKENILLERSGYLGFVTRTYRKGCVQQRCHRTKHPSFWEHQLHGTYSRKQETPS